MINHKIFQISDFHPTPEALLGRGVWGEVYDLGDETVLKKCRAVGGVGDGCAKLRKEEALEHLFAGLCQESLSFALPRCLGAGTFAQETPEGFRAWKRSTRLPGRSGRVSESAPVMGESLGKALRQFHVFLEDSQCRGLAEPDAIFQDLAGGPALSEQDAEMARAVHPACS